MSTSCDRARRARVIREGEAAAIRAAAFEGELAPGDLLAGIDPSVVAAAIEEGRRAGFAQGLAEGREAAAEQVAAHRDALDRMAAALGEAAEDLRARQASALREVEGVLGAAAVELARAVLGRELTVTASGGADAVARALALVPPRAVAVVRVNPGDLDAAAASGALAGRPVELVGDVSVEPGGCLVEAGDLLVDAQIGAALERARLVLCPDAGAG